jgi:ABC-2 type transport system permease protein
VKYLAVLRTRTLAGLMYERDLAIRSAFMLVALVTFVQLWSTTFDATGQTTVQGFSVRDLVWYLVITEIVALSTANLVQTIDTEVRAGDVAYALGRPMSYPLFHLAGYWGETLVRLPANVLVGSVVGLLAVGPPEVTVLGVAATVLTLALAITLRGCFEVLIGLSAFWIEDTLPIVWLQNKFLLTIGGTFIPLELFPAWLAGVARALPFASVQYAPARAFVGASPEQLVGLIAGQLVWLLIAWALVQLMFTQATRRLVAHGG